jgi:hypothetical protein
MRLAAPRGRAMADRPAARCIDAIIVGARLRRELGDIASLARSIDGGHEHGRCFV